MNSDLDILQENSIMLRSRHELLLAHSDLSPESLGLTKEAATELLDHDQHKIARVVDCVAPLFNFAMEDQVIRAIDDSYIQTVPVTDELEVKLQDDALLLIANRWASARSSPNFARAVLGMSSVLIDALREATYSDIKRVVARGIRPQLAVSHQYLFHSGRNITLMRVQRTHLAICNARNNSF